MSTAPKVTSRSLFETAQYEMRDNKYPGRCDSCGRTHGEGTARIVRPVGGAKWGAQWIFLCRVLKCTRVFLASLEGPAKDEANDSDYEI